MKNFIIFPVLISVCLFLLLTGFQCASQEMTTAKLAIKNQDYASAEKWLAKETEKNPANAEAWWLLGFSRTQILDFKGAIDAFDASLSNSDEFSRQIKQARQSVWGQLINQAVGKYNESLSGSADDVKGSLVQEAIESYMLALKVNPDSAITYQNLAVAYHAQGKTDDEIKMLKEALQRKNLPQLQVTLINRYLDKALDAESKKETATADEYYNLAIADIKKGLETDPENVELLETMINIYVSRGQAADAKPYIEQAIAKNPDNKVYHYNLGVLLMQSDDSIEEAITHFEKALQTDPNYDVALQNAGVAYMRVGDKAKKTEDKSYIDKFKKAVGYFERLRDVKPEDANSYDLLASGYANANMLKEAEEALKKADSLRNK